MNPYHKKGIEEDMFFGTPLGLKTSWGDEN